MLRLTALDGLRGYAALAVVFFHSIHLSEAQQQVLLRAPVWSMADGYTLAVKLWLMIFSGQAAVTIFFVLSGAVLFRSLMASSEPLLAASMKFAVRRVLRIYPALVVCLVACAAIFVAFGVRTTTAQAFRDNLWLYEFGVNGATWTLQIEMLAVVYLLGLFVVYRLAGETALVVAAGVSFLVLHHAVPDETLFLFRFYALSFVVGLLVPTRFGRAVVAALPSWAWIVALAALLLSRHVGLPFKMHAHQISAGILVGLLYYGRAPALAAVLETRTAQYLGAISFSLYLFNVLFLEVALAWAKSLPWAAAHPLETAPALAIAVIALTIPVAHFSLVYVEEPFIRFGRWLTRAPSVSLHSAAA